MNKSQLKRKRLLLHRRRPLPSPPHISPGSPSSSSATPFSSAFAPSGGGKEAKAGGGGGAKASADDDHDEYSNVKREVAVMKKLHHPNCVRLFEVIDDPDNDKLYLGMIRRRKKRVGSDSRRRERE